MKRLLSQKVSLAVLALVLSAAAVQAQTGPTGQPSSTITSNTTPSMQKTQMTPDSLSKILTKEGHLVEVKNLNDGGKLVVATIVRDNWRFVVEFEFNKTGNNMNVICPLGNAAKDFASAQLLALMKKSYELPCPMHFSYRASDGRMVLEDPCYNTFNMTDVGVRNILDRLLRTVRDTHPLWDASRWPVSGNVPA